MLRVLQHYIPLRITLLVLGELLILWTILSLGMTEHLWGITSEKQVKDGYMLRELNALGLTPGQGMLRCLISSALAAFLSQMALGFNQLYEFSVSSSRYRRAARFVESAGVALLLNVVVMGLAQIWGLKGILDFPGLGFSQKLQGLLLSLITAFAALYLFRYAYHALLHRANLSQRLLILGSGGPAHSLARQVLEHPEAGFEIVGMLPEPPTDRQDKRRSSDQIVTTVDHRATVATERLVLNEEKLLFGGVQNLGVAMNDLTHARAKRLMELVKLHKVDQLVVALEDRRNTLPTPALLRCRLSGIDVREREEIYEEITGRIAISAMRPSYLIFGEGFRRHAWADLAKRSTDIFFALIILALFWPFMLLTYLIVRVGSPGPALFTQERIGLNGEPFILMKFRSMRIDAEAQTGAVWATEDDPRITKVGKFIRKTRLDELPQLFNVLKGNMSLVGPRPERGVFVDQLAKRIPYYQQRHTVKPGITGWAQINYPYGNTEEDALHKLQYDLFYIKNHSMLYDISILFSTIKTVLLRKGT
ncbi:MAG: TIGR03013 family PEP-CTERM/XrtA system glycosyltransferase [Planctomycetota bacterium]|nr:TIGR03013 family PEP-CTERM/XrtA system glycosyltransferase [Planctomycetota bacterium]